MTESLITYADVLTAGGTITIDVTSCIDNGLIDVADDHNSWDLLAAAQRAVSNGRNLIDYHGNAVRFGHVTGVIAVTIYEAQPHYATLDSGAKRGHTIANEDGPR